MEVLEEVSYNKVINMWSDKLPVFNDPISKWYSFDTKVKHCPDDAYL